MKLYIDSRETSKLTEQVEAQALGYNIPIEKTWLEIGDYIFEDVCFEAKSSFDFLQSAVNKRLWSQIDNMDRAFTHNTVIVYGSISSAIKEYQKYIKSTDKFPTRLLENKFLGAIGKIILDTDCNIVLTSDSKTAAKIICAVFKMKPTSPP